MSRAFAAPRTIRRIAARRVYESARGRPVTVTIGVPQAVPGSDWGCALQITGLNSTWRRPRYVFGIDALQALQMAMQCASTVLAKARGLSWLEQRGELFLPRFLPQFPRKLQDRLAAIVEREEIGYWQNLVREKKAKRASRLKAERRRAGAAKR